MSNTGDTPPAGWYPDPDDATQLRFWNGSAWTEQRRTAASMPPPAAPFSASGPTPPPPPRPVGGSSNAGTALGLSIFGLICCGLAAPFGMVMGRNEVLAIDRGSGDVRQRGTAQAAYVIGLIATILYVLGFVLWFVIVAASSS
ncbi:MAG: DUF2510 domain-containing protein [Actinomycetota bacterium]